MKTFYFRLFLSSEAAQQPCEWLLELLILKALIPGSDLAHITVFFLLQLREWQQCKKTEIGPWPRWQECRWVAAFISFSTYNAHGHSKRPEGTAPMNECVCVQQACLNLISWGALPQAGFAPRGTSAALRSVTLGTRGADDDSALLGSAARARALIISPPLTKGFSLFFPNVEFLDFTLLATRGEVECLACAAGWIRLSLVLTQFPGVHFLWWVLLCDVVWHHGSGRVLSEGELILGAGSGTRHAGVYSVPPLPPCGIESQSRTRWVICKTGLTFLSLPLGKKNRYFKICIYWAPVMVSCCWHLFAVESAFRKDFQWRVSLYKLFHLYTLFHPILLSRGKQCHTFLMYPSRAALCRHKQLQMHSFKKNYYR